MGNVCLGEKGYREGTCGKARTECSRNSSSVPSTKRGEISGGGVRALKAPFYRLRLPLGRNASCRIRVLTVCVHLLNLRTALLGINQLRTVNRAHEIDPNPCIKRYVEEQEKSRSNGRNRGDMRIEKKVRGTSRWTFCLNNASSQRLDDWEPFLTCYNYNVQIHISKQTYLYTFSCRNRFLNRAITVSPLHIHNCSPDWP